MKTKTTAATTTPTANVQMLIRVPPTLRRRLRIAAALEERSITDLVAAAAERYVVEIEQRHGITAVR